MPPEQPTFSQAMLDTGSAAAEGAILKERQQRLQALLTDPGVERNPKAVLDFAADILGPELGGFVQPHLHTEMGDGGRRTFSLRLITKQDMPEGMQQALKIARATDGIGMMPLGGAMASGAEAGWRAMLARFFPEGTPDRRTSRDITVQSLMELKTSYEALRKRTSVFGGIPFNALKRQF